MRIQAFLVVVSLVGLCGGGSLAQSGYVTVRFAGGLTLVGNHLKATNNTVAQFMPQPAEGAELYKFANGSFTTNTVRSSVWTNPDEKLEPGEGAVVFNPTGRPFEATFRGTLPQGNLVNRIPAGRSVKVSLAPQSGRVTTDLGLTLSPFDNLYLWKSNRFEIYTVLPDGSWFPSEPAVSIGQSFFIRASKETQWVRSFNLNQP
jgi:hypothetical protein